MQNSKRQAGTEADSEMQPKLPTSRPNNAKPIVGCSISSSDYEHLSTFKAHCIFLQLEERDIVCSHWMLYALQRLLYERPNLKVSTLIGELEILLPQTMISVMQSD